MLLDTALILNQHCQLTDKSESAGYPTALIASKEKLFSKNILLKTDISVVGYSANAESVLYHTALIPNMHCRIHR